MGSHQGHKPRRLSDTKQYRYRHQAILCLSIQTPKTPAFATDLSSDQRVGGSSPSERANRGGNRLRSSPVCEIHRKSLGCTTSLTLSLPRR
jgi:hypothetical protein